MLEEYGWNTYPKSIYFNFVHSELKTKTFNLVPFLTIDTFAGGLAGALIRHGKCKPNVSQEANRLEEMLSLTLSDRQGRRSPITTYPSCSSTWWLYNARHQRSTLQWDQSNANDPGPGKAEWRWWDRSYFEKEPSKVPFKLSSFVQQQQQQKSYFVQGRDTPILSALKQMTAK